MDQHGNVLDVLVQSWRSACATKRLFRKLWQMQRFRLARHAQRVLSTRSRIHNHVQLRRHRLTADQHRAARNAAFRTWREVTGVASPA